MTKLTEKKLNKLINEFIPDVEITEKLLILNGFLEKENGEMFLTENGKILVGLIKEKRSKK